MKLTSYFSIFHKMLVVGAFILCASQQSSARSILDQERGEIDAIRAQLFGASDSYMGALTFENLYNFDYANAGIGTVIFRTSSKHLPPFVVDQESSRPVGDWGWSSGYSFSFISPNFASSSPSFVKSGALAAFDDPNQLTSPDILAPVPEPSTWIGGALVLAFVLFTQRRRFASRSRAIA